MKTKPTLLMLKGLPASGKSTYAKEKVLFGWTRVNKDDLRAMMHNSKWSKGNEAQIIKTRNDIVINSLEAGRSVVVDDTNFAPAHEDELRKLAAAFSADFKVEFIDTPLDECIKRDLQRPVSVGEKVIRKMYNQYLRPEPPVVKYDPTLPDIILCDIDGTLAHMHGRSPYDWARVGEDTVDLTVQSILNNYAEDEGIEVVFMSGRSDVCRTQTSDWLYRHSIDYRHLFMRAADDKRADNIVKRELYMQHIRGKFNVLFVLDDRDQVVDMWRNELGLKVLQVAEGDF